VQEDDAGDPLVLPPPARIVGETAATHPAAPAPAVEAGLPKRPTLHAYQARAPPAA
jgi:hypothetical protein